MLLLEGMASLPAGEGAAAAWCHATGRAWLCKGEARGRDWVWVLLTTASILLTQKHEEKKRGGGEGRHISFIPYQKSSKRG